MRMSVLRAVVRRKRLCGGRRNVIVGPPGGRTGVVVHYRGMKEGNGPETPVPEGR